MTRDCRWPLAESQKKIGPPNHTANFKEMKSADNLAGLEADPSPVEPPDENTAWLKPQQQPWETLSRAPS